MPCRVFEGAALSRRDARYPFERDEIFAIGPKSVCEGCKLVAVDLRARGVERRDTPDPLDIPFHALFNARGVTGADGAGHMALVASNGANSVGIKDRRHKHTSRGHQKNRAARIRLSHLVQ